MRQQSNVWSAGLLAFCGGLAGVLISGLVYDQCRCREDLAILERESNDLREQLRQLISEAANDECPQYPSNIEP